ncbi:DUF6276 family protein [Salinigranum sp. GCM10025319]|uniref:DUF6276 family protein n=1 Tax=Salinigranum sp. GCM10025319 TaxID=3252687 RepID=UPI00361CB9DB
MTCPACDGDRVAFTVPASLQSYAPEESPRAAICTGCLRVSAVDATDDESSDSVAVDWEPLPTGEAGVATALIVGLLDSLALRRAEITALVDHAEAAGGDPLSALDRLSELAATGEIDPYVDLDRRAAQLRSMLA